MMFTKLINTLSARKLDAMASEFLEPKLTSLAGDEPSSQQARENQALLDQVFENGSTARPASLSEKKRVRGRPKGRTNSILAPTTHLMLEDFFWLRAVISGLDPLVMYQRYYGHLYSNDLGAVVPHGNTLVHRAKRLVWQILKQAQYRNGADGLEKLAKQLAAPVPKSVDTIAKEAVALGFECWQDTIPRDFYRENELLERYQEYLYEHQQETRASSVVLARARSLDSKLRALNGLQTALARRPALDHGVNLWFAPKLASSFASNGIHTLQSLKFRIAIDTHWYRRIRSCGRTTATRVEQWLEFHSETLNTQPSLNRQYDRVPPPGQLVAEAPSALVPIDRVQIPESLSGQSGLFRSKNINQLGANTDLAALSVWLNRFLSAGQLRTHQAYKREVERFYLWCILEQKVAFSSVTLAHAQTYQKFLQNTPKHWVADRHHPRSSPFWRPFRGQLSARSQNYALGILKSVYKGLIQTGYVTSSPFEAVLETIQARSAFSVDTTRCLSRSDLTALKSHLERPISHDLRTAASTRRMNLVIQLALRTGLRRSELATASFETLEKVEVGHGQYAHIITIVGKGSRTRTVPLADELIELIYEHHADVRELMSGYLQDEFYRKPALVCALEPPPNPSIKAKANGGVSADTIYRVIKQAFGHSGIQKATPHWMRHTFARAVLAGNFHGKGLAMTKKLLGHASLSTTGHYIEQETSEIIGAALATDPFGQQ